MTIVVGLSSLAVFIWLGVCMIVPQAPFSQRNIAGGVLLIVFSTFACALSGLLTSFLTGGICWLSSECCDDDCC